MQITYWGITKRAFVSLNREAQTNIEAVINRLLRLNNTDLEDLAEYLFEQYV